MTKDQLARLERHRKVRKILTDNAAVVAAVPAFARVATAYQAQLTLLDGAAERNAVSSEGATQSKSAAAVALTARLVKAANALYLVYKAAVPTPNLTEAAKLRRRRSDYTSLTALELATEAAALSGRVTANTTLLRTDYNLSAADQQALAAEAAAFSANLPNPQLAIDAAKTKGATTKTTLSALNAFLRDDLRAGLELLRDTAPDTYRALREASQVNDAAYRPKRVARGTPPEPAA